jgi:peroxiredoxin
MALATQLSNQYNDFTKSAPAAIKDPIIAAKTSFINTYDTSQVIKPGTRLPPFSLPSATGETVDSSTYLSSETPLLITFYRGSWCPFCSLALNAHQSHLDTYKSHGVEFIAISPELPDTSLSAVEKAELKFPVLSDVGNAYARQLGIVFRQSESLRQPFETLGINLKERNGDDSFEVPVPVSLLVDGKGVVREVFAEPDFTKRLEPETAVQWIEKLEGRNDQ